MAVASAFQFAADFLAAERGQAVEAKLEDRADLRFAEAISGAGGLRLDRLDQHDILA